MTPDELAVVNHWLVERGSYPGNFIPGYGYEPYSDCTPLVNLTTVPGYVNAEELQAAVDAVREVHRPVDVEPSETICAGCSTLRGTGERMRYFPYEEWPCDTIRALDEHLGS